MQNKPIRLLIKSNYKELTPTEQEIANYVLDDPHKVARSTIKEIASDLNIADSTFFQFTRQLGFKGFKDFKIAVLSEEKDITTSIHEDIVETDSEQEIAIKVFNSTIQSISNTLKMLDMNGLKKAAQILINSNKTHIFGLGGSSYVAGDAYHKFLRSPINVQHSFDYHVQLMETSLLTDRDCALVISHTGKSKETLEIAKQVKKQGASLISITGYARSPLAQMSDIVLTTEADETIYRSEALASRVAQMAIIDSLLVIVMFNDEEKSKDTLDRVREVIKKQKISTY